MRNVIKNKKKKETKNFSNFRDNNVPYSCVPYFNLFKLVKSSYSDKGEDSDE